MRSGVLCTSVLGYLWCERMPPFPKDAEANNRVRREYWEGHWAVPKGV